MSEEDLSGDIVDRSGKKIEKYQLPDESEPDEYEDDAFEESNELIQITQAQVQDSRGQLQVDESQKSFKATNPFSDVRMSVPAKAPQLPPLATTPDNNVLDENINNSMRSASNRSKQ